MSRGGGMSGEKAHDVELDGLGGREVDDLELLSLGEPVRGERTDKLGDALR